MQTSRTVDFLFAVGETVEFQHEHYRILRRRYDEGESSAYTSYMLMKRGGGEVRRAQEAELVPVRIKEPGGAL